MPKIYTDSDLDAAVTAGILSQDTANRFRAFAKNAARATGADEEYFRLITGFNDIFVSIACGLVLAAVIWLTQGWIMGPLPLAPAVSVAILSWGLAEYFTRKRRMALPSILLLISFVGSIFTASLSLTMPLEGNLGLSNGVTAPVLFALAAACTGFAAYGHWWRFKVPITVAAGSLAGFGMAISLLNLIPALQGPTVLICLIGLAGVGQFCIAMAWDISDRTRITRRADIAFWLHLTAAPMIVHPAFGGILGVFTSTYSAGAVPSDALIAVGIYGLLAVIAIVVDRRALLISALFYLVYAVSGLFRFAGSVDASSSLPVLVIGGALLLLSIYWHALRKLIVTPLPTRLREVLPPV